MSRRILTIEELKARRDSLIKNIALCSKADIPMLKRNIYLTNFRIRKLEPGPKVITQKTTSEIQDGFIRRRLGEEPRTSGRWKLFDRLWRKEA